MTDIEAVIETLHFPYAPKMAPGPYPGPRAAEALALSARTESMACGGGRMPVVMDRAFGATFKDPDGSTFIDLSAAPVFAASSASAP